MTLAKSASAESAARAIGHLACATCSGRDGCEHKREIRALLDRAVESDAILDEAIRRVADIVCEYVGSRGAGHNEAIDKAIAVLQALRSETQECPPRRDTALRSAPTQGVRLTPHERAIVEAARAQNEIHTLREKEQPSTLTATAVLLVQILDRIAPVDKIGIR